MSAVVGALRAILALDSAAFLRGAKAAQGGLAKLQAGFDRVGQKMQDAGAAMSVAVTGPLAAMALATKRATDNLSDLGNQAKVANTLPQDFKVMAIAAEQFGVQQDKLADILKDVNDRVGEFVQTGGGPMKDFFEKIGPKVGVTAEHFKNLSGKDALQLYVSSLEKAGVSQQDMTFYMEAMAGDAALLIPLLQNNGKAMSEVEARARALGLTIDNDLVAGAGKARSEFALVREVLAVQMQQALVRLAPAFQSLMSIAVPVIEALARWATAAGEAFAKLSPETQGLVAGMLAVAAAIGPVLVGFGLFVAGMAPVIGALKAVAGLALLNPFVLIGAAAVGAAYLIYSNWETVKTFFVGVFDSIKTSATAAWDGVKQMALDAVTATTGAWTGIREYFGLVLANVKNAFLDGWEAIKAEVSQWPARFVQFGEEIVEGLRQGIVAKWDGMVASLQGKWDGLKASFADAFGIRSPSRVFRGYGQNITEGLALGVEDQLPMVDGAMGKVVEAVGAQGLTGGLLEFRDAARDVFSQVAFQGKKLGEALRGVASNWLGQKAGQLFNTGFNSLFGSIFGGGGGGAGSLGLPMPFAKGGAFNAGRVTAFAKGGVVAGATAFAMQGGIGIMGEAGPEAIMPLKRGANGSLGVQAMGGGGLSVTIGFDASVNGFTAMVRNEAGRVVAQATPGIVQQSVGATYQAAREVPIA